MPGKVRVSRKEKPVRKRTLNRGLLVLGGSLVFILGIILVSLWASGSLTKKPGETTSTVLAAPDFQLTTFGGSKYALSQDQGKVRVVFFMIAPYWPGCVLEVPGLVELEEEYASKGVRFIGINLDANSDSSFIKNYVAKLGASNFVWVTDSLLDTARAYNVRSAGVTVIVDRKGGVSYRDDAPTTKGKLQAELERALSPSSSGGG